MTKVGLEDVLRELKDVKERVGKLESIVEQRLVGEVEPREDERKSIQDYEKKKKRKDLEIIPLEEALKEIGVHSSSRKKSR